MGDHFGKQAYNNDVHIKGCCMYKNEGSKFFWSIERIKLTRLIIVSNIMACKGT